MDDLITWLRAQLDDDERTARAACDGDSGKWFVGRKWNVYHAEDGTPCDDYESNQLVVYGNAAADSEHIARQDPARVLADVEAKRQIIELHKPVGITTCNTCHSGWTAELNPADFPCDTLRLLALPYADRPGYRAEWRP